VCRRPRSPDWRSVAQAQREALDEFRKFCSELMLDNGKLMALYPEQEWMLSDYFTRATSRSGSALMSTLDATLGQLAADGWIWTVRRRERRNVYVLLFRSGSLLAKLNASRPSSASDSCTRSPRRRLTSTHRVLVAISREISS
jgi:hypothetical protein